MKFGIFDNYGARNSPPVFDAFKRGASALGLTCSSHDMSADIAVIWSIVWAGRMKNNQPIWEEFRRSGRHVIVLEVGALKRGITWKMGVNGTGRYAIWGHGNDLDRPEKLGLQLKPWRTAGERIVIATQREDSEQWHNQPPMGRWLMDTVAELREYTQRPIYVRGHPRQRVMIPGGCQVEPPKPVANTYDSFDLSTGFNNTWAVINHNSGVGVEATIAGIPAFVDRSSLAEPVGNTDYSMIEQPTMPDRSNWLIDISHTEWTVDEIATGYPLSRILKTL